MSFCLTSACKKKRECDQKAQAAAAMASSQGPAGMAVAYKEAYDKCMKSSGVQPTTNGWDFLNNVFDFYKDIKHGDTTSSMPSPPSPEKEKKVLGLPPAAGYTALTIGGALIIYAIYHVATINR